MARQLHADLTWDGKFEQAVTYAGKSVVTVWRAVVYVEQNGAAVVEACPN